MTFAATPGPAVAADPTGLRSTARWTAVGALAAGVLLLLFPLLRPWPDESEPSLPLAHELASTAWVVSHLCGIAGLGLLAPTFLGLRALLRSHGRLGVRAATAAVVTAWVGAGLCALYYGAEIFGIRTIAETALRTADRAVLADVEALRMQPGAVVLFGAGLALIAAAGVLIAVALRRTGARWGAVVVAAGLVLYLPQFFGSPGVRVAHGVLLAAGLLHLAWVVATSGETSDTTTAGHPEG